MRYLASASDKGLRVIDEYLRKRLSFLKGKDRIALIQEYKEWLLEENEGDVDIWTIPDLTDEGLCDFFKRVISRKYS